MVKEDAKQFSVGDMVVYPSHGVGQVIGEESQVLGGIEVKLYVISFSKDRMTLRVPVGRAIKTGLRHLSTSTEFEDALKVLRTKSRASRSMMWSKRAQEYETKINSGNIIAIAEVLRDLHKNIENADRSYSERLIYESALTRLTNEYSIAADIDPKTAGEKIIQILDELKQEAA